METFRAARKMIAVLFILFGVFDKTCSSNKQTQEMGEFVLPKTEDGVFNDSIEENGFITNRNTKSNGSHLSCKKMHRNENDCGVNFNECVNGKCIVTLRDENILSLKPKQVITCHCDPGWIGFFCDVCCNLDCGKNGYCEIDHLNGRIPICRCDWGFDGDRCEMEVEDSSNKTMSKHITSSGGQNWRLYLSLIAIFGFVFVAAAALLITYIWKNRQQIILKISQAVHGMRTQDEECGDVVYDYDAFISYRGTTEDEQFVYHTLLPKLEREYGFRLCVHHRDFVPGETIANNIIKAIQGSRHTILILSPGFLQSEWTRMEYQVAQHEMLKLRHRIIPIMFQSIKQVSNMDENLKLILNTVTFLEWPERDFWKKLCKALTKDKHGSVSDVGEDEKSRTVSISTCQTQISITESVDGNTNKEVATKITSI